MNDERVVARNFLLESRRVNALDEAPFGHGAAL